MADQLSADANARASRRQNRTNTPHASEHSDARRTTTHGRRRVSARRASRLLDVVRAAAAAPAHGVRLVVALAEAASSLACLALFRTVVTARASTRISEPRVANGSSNTDDGQLTHGAQFSAPCDSRAAQPAGYRPCPRSTSYLTHTRTMVPSGVSSVTPDRPCDTA